MWNACAFWPHARKELPAMKAILCSRYGTPDDLELGDLPDPQPGEGEVVVKVAAAALNFFDTLLLAGRYQVKPDFPFSPAAEFAGTVHGIGAGVSGFMIGDRVMGYAGYGAAREYVVARAARLVKVPDKLDLDRAAGLSVTYGTTIHALKDRAKLKAGETLAVLGAAGGTGLAAVEIGKLMGARVIGREMRFCEKAWRRRDHQLRHGRSARRVEAAGRRAWHRRGLRSGRRQICRARVAIDGVGRAISGDRIRRRRNPENSAEPRAAEGLRYLRRVLRPPR
jgi:NADPH2:quinone reductase